VYSDIGFARSLAMTSSRFTSPPSQIPQRLAIFSGSGAAVPGVPVRTPTRRALERTPRRGNHFPSTSFLPPAVFALSLPAVSGRRISRQEKRLSLHAGPSPCLAGVLARSLTRFLWLRRNRNNAGFESEDKMATTTGITVKITMNDKGNPPGKLADAELHFTDGPLEGLKLIGFSIWERRTGAGRNVTFPARQYSINGERRSFALLRPIADTAAQDRIRELVLDAYAEAESAQA
jgi:hypothetical protein